MHDFFFLDHFKIEARNDDYITDFNFFTAANNLGEIIRDSKILHKICCI